MAKSSEKAQNMPWKGLVTGLIVGAFAAAIFEAIGLQISLQGKDATAGLYLLQIVLTGLLGFSYGQLMQTNFLLQQRLNNYRDTMREEDKAKTKNRKQQQLKTIGKVASNVAHEVKTPLGVIRNSTERIKGALPSERMEAHKACSSIADEVSRLDSYVGQLVEYGKPLRTNLTNINIHSVVDRSLELAKDRLDEAGIDVSLALPDSLPMPKGDIGLIEQTILIFLNNAIDAAGAGGQIEVRANCGENLVYIEVADSGPGVPSKIEGRIYEAFYTTKDASAGLGLATAARVADVHGGVVRVIRGAGAGKNGKGACFNLSLPRVNAEGELEPVAATTSTTAEDDLESAQE